MTPSETVKAAQRLLAEREAVGLKKYGTTVDRTDLQAGDWLQHAIEEASDLLLYLIRLRETIQATRPSAIKPKECRQTRGLFLTPEHKAVHRDDDSGWFERCPCGDRLKNACPGEWRSGCELPKAPNPSQPAPAEAPEEATPVTDWNLYTSPQPAFDPEDAERAAYLARWKDAPEEATHLAQDADGACAFYESMPALDSDQNWFGHVFGDAESNLLGSVRCEPRPVQGVGE